MGFVLALISSAAFGLIPLFSLPLLHSGLSADCVLFYRFLFASISLGLILILRQERLAAPARDLGLLALFSVLYALAALLMIWGLLYLSGGVTATLQFLYPLMVMLIMTIFFHEKFSIITASSVLLAILGVALLGSGGGDDGGSRLRASCSQVPMISKVPEIRALTRDTPVPKNSTQKVMLRPEMLWMRATCRPEM